jgi:tRNA(Glu) U13 pseudouridine synthase TruD
VRGTLRLINETFASRARLAEELVVLRGHERGGTAKAAILALTFQKRSLYTAAYVSALWNELASLRVREHGHADGAVAVAVVGDVLLPPRVG